MSQDIYFAKKGKASKRAMPMVKDVVAKNEGGDLEPGIQGFLGPIESGIKGALKFINGGKFDLPQHTAPKGTKTRGRKPKHVQEVMGGVNLPQHFNKYLTLCKKAVAGGALSAPDMKKLADYTQLDGGGFFSGLWNGIKSTVGKVLPVLAPVVGPILGKLATPLLAPVLGPLAPVVGQLLPKLLGGTLVGKHVDEVAKGENLEKHFKKFISLARTAEKGGALTPKMAKMFNDYKHLNGGGFFDTVWAGLKSAGSKILDNLPAIIENIPKVIDTAKKGYDFAKKVGLFG